MKVGLFQSVVCLVKRTDIFDKAGYDAVEQER